MAGNLENTIGRGVNDGLAACHMLLTKLGDDGGPRRMAVAQYARKIGAFDQLVEEFGRKRVGLFSEISPIEQHGHARDLPVPARRILAAGEFFGVTVGIREET